MERGFPFRGFSPEEKGRIECVISDVDDTITSGGRLLPEALAALYLIRKSGRRIILLTGGSAGWADVYARQWPVDGVIAESGALMISNEGGRIIYRTNPVIEEKRYMEQRNSFLSMLPSSSLSSDQYARIYDIAVDKAKISDKERAFIIAEAERTGAFYSESSIHINIWFAPYDKWLGLQYFTENSFGISHEDLKQRSIYLGDGLNDQIIFREIPLSIGMNSVERMRNEFKCLPLYITDENGGLGFKKVIDSIV